MIHREHIFRLLEEAGRAETGGREQLTLREVFEAYGGPRSGASRRLSEELQVSQRQVQRMVTEHGAEKRGMGPKSVRYFRELSDRELRRAGARYFRQNPLTIDDGSEFALCYHSEQQGDEREIRGDAVTLADNDEWLDHFDRGEFGAMENSFTDQFLEAYGVEAGDVDVCDEDGGQNLHAALG